MIRVALFNEISHELGNGLLKDIRGRIVERINDLLRQMSANAPYLTFEHFLKFLGQPNNHFIVAVEGEDIIGMGTLVFGRTLMGRHAKIEDVVVDEKHRGKKIGRQIVEELIRIAREGKAKMIDLTSNSSRIEALALYRSLGFKDVATNCLRLELS